MIRFLRYISLRFWLVCLVALPLSFWLLPRSAQWLPAVPPVVGCIMVFVTVGLILGLALDLLGRRRIRVLMREAELWERAGMPGRAENRYLRATGIFDSAWISPLAARYTGPGLMAAVARFYLTAGRGGPGFERAAILYLLAHPGDETLALLWLGQADLGPGEGQAVLTALADAHYANPEIRRHLVPKFLESGRTDFSARRLYRHFQAAVAHTGATGEEKVILAGIETLVGTLGEAGEINGHGNGLGRTLGDLANGAGHIPVMVPEASLQGDSLMKRTGTAAAGGATALVAGLKKMTAGTVDLLRSRYALKMVKLGSIGVLGVWLGIFAWSTLSHMVESVPEPAQRIEVRIRKPYTIQVAAYLKPSHARRYVAALKKKGITATVNTTGAGGKTWYLVRVSEFTDKQSAVDYGNRLKSQEIIDEFFVSNK